MTYSAYMVNKPNNESVPAVASRGNVVNKPERVYRWAVNGVPFEVSYKQVGTRWVITKGADGGLRSINFRSAGSLKDAVDDYFRELHGR